MGADSIFMGVLRRYEVEPGMIRVWVMPSGAVVSVDDRFTDGELLVLWGKARGGCALSSVFKYARMWARVVCHGSEKADPIVGKCIRHTCAGVGPASN